MADFTVLDAAARADQIRAYRALIDLVRNRTDVVQRQPYPAVAVNDVVPRRQYPAVQPNQQRVSHKLDARPPRVTIINTDTGEELEAQYNPTELSRGLEVAYNVIQADGLGFTPMQYRNTSAQALKLTFELSAISDSQDDMNRALRFYESLCYPTLSPSGKSLSPPPVLFVWPTYISMTCVVTKWQETTSKFSTATMEPILAKVEIELSEARLTALYSDDVRENGGWRP